MKTKIKGLLTIICASVLTFTASACDPKSTINTFDDVDTDPTYLNFFSSTYYGQYDISKYWSERFAQEYNREVYVNYDSAEYYSDNGLSYRELLLKRLESSSPDDMYIINAEDVLEFGKKGYWMDLTGMDFVDNLSEAALYQSTYDGQVYSLPLSYTGFGLVWNVDMLKGLDLSVPHTLSEFKTVLKKLKENGILPYGANKGYGLTVPAMCIGLSELYSKKDRTEEVAALNAGKPISDYMVKGFEFLQWMIDEGYLDAEQALKTTPRTDDFQMLKDGKCAFICMGLGDNGTIDFNWEQTGLPVLEDGCVAVYGATDRLCVNPNTKNLDTVLDFINLLGTNEALEQSASLTASLSSSKVDNHVGMPQQENLATLLKQSNQIPNQDFSLHFNTWENIRDAAQELCKGKTVEEACEFLNQRQWQNLEDYGKVPVKRD